jgi:hypothetical protein
MIGFGFGGGTLQPGLMGAFSPTSRFASFHVFRSLVPKVSGFLCFLWLLSLCLVAFLPG